MAALSAAAVTVTLVQAAITRRIRWPQAGEKLPPMPKRPAATGQSSFCTISSIDLASMMVSKQLFHLPTAPNMNESAAYSDAQTILGQ
jgi:hypothetical protein